MAREATAAKKADPRRRTAIARSLLQLQKRLEPDLLKIDAYKEELRELCQETGESFTEEIAGLGSVEVAKGREAKFNGVLPTLAPEIFLKLPKAKREALLRQGLVKEEAQWSKASKPAVTVRL
jgi:hypothetical protein